MTTAPARLAPPASRTPRAEGVTQPPLSTWGTTWRTLVAVIGGVIGFFLSVGMTPIDQTWAIGLDLLAGSLVITLMFFRRRWPLVVALLAVALGSFSGLASGAMTIIIVSLATRRRWREVVPVALLAVLGAWMVAPLLNSDAPLIWFEADPEMAGMPDPAGATGAVSAPGWSLAVIVMFLMAILIAIGFYIGARRDLIATLQARAETAEREQFARESQARTAERSEIAREMHDVLAHRISLVAMHSGALTYRTDLDAAETAATAEIIRDNAHLALTELRQVLGVLRDDTRHETGPDLPQPTLATLDELIDHTSVAGNGTELILAPETEPYLATLSSTTGRTAYRILQETLTNVRKHAPGAKVLITLAGVPGARLTLEVRNPVPFDGSEDTRLTLPSSGMGLTGLKERAALAGGELTHEVDRAGDFVVRAWLPWQN